MWLLLGLQVGCRASRTCFSAGQAHNGPVTRSVYSILTTLCTTRPYAKNSCVRGTSLRLDGGARLQSPIAPFSPSLSLLGPQQELAGLGRGSRVRVIEATYWPREERALLSTLLLAPPDDGPIRAPTIAETGDGGGRTPSDIETELRNLNLNLGDSLRRGGVVVDLLESPVEVLASVFDGPSAGGEKAADVRRGLAIATVCTSRDQVSILVHRPIGKDGYPFIYTWQASCVAGVAMPPLADGLVCLSCRAVAGSGC